MIQRNQNKIKNYKQTGDDEKALDINKLNCCLLHEQLENDFENLINDERFLTNKCLSLQKENDDLNKEIERLHSFHDISKKFVQCLQDSFFNLIEIKKNFIRFNPKRNLQKLSLPKRKDSFKK